MYVSVYNNNIIPNFQLLLLAPPFYYYYYIVIIPVTNDDIRIHEEFMS